jgi:hypothetical protein
MTPKLSSLINHIKSVTISDEMLVGFGDIL